MVLFLTIHISVKSHIQICFSILVLKHTLRQGRPLVRPSLLHEYGMPSSHSQFMWFFTTYMFLFIWVRLRHISYTNTIWIWIWKTAISVACLVASIIVAIARFYTNSLFILSK